MSQKSIKHFFKSEQNEQNEKDNNKIGKGIKRQLSNESPIKKIKLAVEKENLTDDTLEKSNENIDDTTPLTPNQEDKIQQNKMKALLKEQSIKTSLLDPNIGLSWFEFLKDEFSRPYFQKLSDFVTSERSSKTIFPPAEEVFSWTRFCPMNEVKVVILGQDPYHGNGQAHGLAFSVQKGISAPPSLVNMFKELQNDIPGFERPNHGCLTGWAEQGVLLLNACLTVQSGNANSHKGRGWERVTEAVVCAVAEAGTDVVFLLWGGAAKERVACINKKKHHFLYAPHPSPLSAHRGFLGCAHFSKCNQILQEHGKKPVDWTHLP